MDKQRTKKEIDEANAFLNGFKTCLNLLEKNRASFAALAKNKSRIVTVNSFVKIFTDHQNKNIEGINFKMSMDDI